MIGLLRSARDARAVIKALDQSQAMIEFDLSGKILRANKLFLDAMGYSLSEIVGRHHSMFVDDAYRASPAYAQFWDALKRGEHQTAEFKRLGKGGREVWLQASYNPIIGTGGRPCKGPEDRHRYLFAQTTVGRLRGAGQRDRQVAGDHRVQDGWHSHHGE